MLQGLSVLLLCQLAGEAIVRGLGAPVPGPVIGIVLLLLALSVVHRVHGRDPTQATGPAGAADGLLRHLGLLFVPAGAGIAQHLDLIAAHGAAIVVALVGSTVLTLAVTVLVFRGVSKLVGGRHQP